MSMPSRCVLPHFHIDTNRINAYGRSAYVSRLESWHKNGVINLKMSEEAQTELLRGKDLKRIKKATGYVAPVSAIHTHEEHEIVEKIKSTIFPTTATDKEEQQRQDSDVLIVFVAWKYSAILITADGGSKSQSRGILGSAQALRNIALGIHVMRDNEAVSLVEKLVAERDKLAKCDAERTGQKLPDWVGKD